jgi:myosin-crossreactive antigen
MDNGHTTRQDETKFYLIGGGIASLAAAAFLIRDADIPGRTIVILEQLDRLGGSLDGAGSAGDGYVLRGGRMLESKYLCTYDLFSSIPTLDGEKTVTHPCAFTDQVGQSKWISFTATLRDQNFFRLVRDFTIRSAATAVYRLLQLDREPPAVYKGQYDPRVLFRAFKTLHEMTV